MEKSAGAGVTHGVGYGQGRTETSKTLVAVGHHRCVIDLVFGKVRGETRTLGPHKVVVFDRIRLEADGEPIAAFQDEFNQWIVDDAQFARLDVALTVDIQGESKTGEKSRVFGPYLHFSVVDTILYVEQRVFALFDRQTDDWYIHDDGRHWQRIIVRPVRPRS